MKKCSRCSNQATFHITELRKGDVTEIHLCDQHAHEYLSQADDQPEPTSDFEFELDQTETSDPTDDRQCPHCEITFREFRSQGRLGCPFCYIEFQADLVPLLENIHGETQHCGKYPRRAPDSSRRQHELVRLRSDLKEAIDEEKYEEAARLRDSIQALEDELGAPPEPEESED